MKTDAWQKSKELKHKMIMYLPVLIMLKCNRQGKASHMQSMRIWYIGASPHRPPGYPGW